MRFFVIDDSKTTTAITTTVLQAAGHEVQSALTPQGAEEAVLAFQPDAVLLDLMMPHIDGFELCVRFRKHPQLDRTKIIVLSAKSYDFDKRRAKSVGADGFLVKQELLSDPERFLQEVMSLVSKKAELAYWGVRGTLPVPSEKMLGYGGNTPCVSLAVDNEPLLIFDAGTGITMLANHLMAQSKSRVTAKLLISHPHWDHINAIPFFTPLYVKGNEIEIIGPAHGHTSFGEIVSARWTTFIFR
ncbi:response regulator [Methylogaea oryzae]|uniref:response regulator n=1 Tax=Methylogaea oryzae TaxID=1295382 RepID=UPI0006CF356F|nr:response regulator [Methylogaea oryzae]